MLTPITILSTQVLTRSRPESAGKRKAESSGSDLSLFFVYTQCKESD